MKGSENIQYDSNRFHGLDPASILKLFKRTWYLMAAGIILGLFVARFYMGHTMPVYETSATILINETENRPLVDNTELLQGLGLPGGMQNIQNQIHILRSRELIEKTLNSLSYDIEWYQKTIRNILPLYPNSPFNLVTHNKTSFPKDIEFSVQFINDSTFILSSEYEQFWYRDTMVLGEMVEISGNTFSIECRNPEWFPMNGNQLIFFINHSRSSLVQDYMQRISVDLVTRDGSILKVSLKGTNPVRDADFLNSHIESFQHISLDKKNMEAQRRIQFIDDQLVGISDSLLMTENKLQQFRSSHRVMDLSAQGQSIIGQVTLLENESARLNLEANYYDYLSDYLEKDIAEIPIVPITMGITDPGLTRLVEELAEYQGQISIRGGGEMNPLQRNLEQRVRSTKDALRETLNGLKRANTLARAENQEQINRANAQASRLPVTERQLLGIERQFKLNDELYTFLLETRAEQLMQKASNRADSEIIDRADSRYSIKISPDFFKVHFVGVFLGTMIPFLFVFVRFLFNNRIKEEELHLITNIPIIGHIPHNEHKSQTVVFEFPNSSVAESFRVLRSKIQFFTKEAKSPVILVTSALPGDGKTFNAISLAAVYSMLGKKTILVGFDLRKPKIVDDFNLNNNNGLSTWLISKIPLEEAIQTTKFENLDIITSGPIPPNPSELTALEKTKDLIILLKEKYDYVIIDSSPIGVISDTYYLALLADACLLVIRSGKTLRSFVEKTFNEIKQGQLKNVSILINDVKASSINYRYSEKYGYTNGNKSRRVSLIRRIFKS